MVHVSIVFLVALLLMNSSARFCFAAGSEVPILEEQSVNVYVVCLDDVNASGVSNISRVFEGVLLASKVDGVHYWTGELDHEGMALSVVMDEIPINVSVTTITDWTAYRLLVEYANNVIIVNAHGETLPIPNGYAEEEWVDRIADAMLYRNVTWVHVAGYPFHYFWHQNQGNRGEWGEQGLKRLMSHIGITNVTRYPIQTETLDLNVGASYALYDWPEIYEAAYAEFDYLLKVHNLTDNVALCIYGGSQHGPYYVGIIVGFNNGGDFGFYVHLGVTNTYESDRKTPSDSDFCKGFLGSAAAVWAHTMKLASENSILNAEAEIARAEKDKRIKGLNEAVDLLRKAKNAYFSYSFEGKDGAIILAKKAGEASDQAIKPSLTEFELPITVLGIIGVVIIGGLAIRKRNNKHKA